MPLDVPALVNTALDQGLAAAEGHAKDLRFYLEARVQLIAQGAAQIVADRLNVPDFTDDDVRFAFDEIKAAETSQLLVVQATLKAAAQDAMNAVFAVFSAAINQAIGFAVL